MAVRAPEGSVREIYQALNSVHVENSQTYYVRDLSLRRSAVRMAFSEGKLAFLSATDGKVTGIVFTGSGRAIAAPRDPVEKSSLARFLGEAVLDQPFSRAYIRFTDDSADELRKQIVTAGLAPTPDPAFGEEWNSVVSNLNPGHSLRILADWLSANPQPYFYAGLQGDNTGPFDVLVDQRREEQVLIGQPKWVGNARYYDTWASFSDSPNNGRSANVNFNPYSQTSFVIETTIRPDLVLEGRTRLTLKTVRGGERLVGLELSRALIVESVTDGAGQKLEFFQNEAVNRQEIALRGNDLLLVALPEQAREGMEIVLTISYRGSVISDAGNGVFFVGERGSWYPHIAGADQFATYDLTFRFPRKLRLVATGKKLNEREEGEWRVSQWKPDIPYPVAGFNLGDYESQQIASGNLIVEMYANKELEQVIASRFVRSMPPPTISAPPVVTRPGTPPAVARLVLPDAPAPSPAALLKKLGADLADAVHFYEKIGTPFPFERLSVAQIPGSFGQGWPGLLYLSTLSFLSPEAQSRVGISRRTQEQFTEIIPFHEVAHQWWGGVVGWSSYRDQWIAEGLSNYLALMYLDQRKPESKELASWLETYRHDLSTKEPSGDEIMEAASPLSLGFRLRSSKSPAAYTQIVYGKGSWIFHMLRMMMRDTSPTAKNPDARFIEVLRGLLEQHRFKALSNADLARAFQSKMLPSMDLDGDHTLDWFFDQWVRNTGIPRYKVEYTAKPAALKPAASQDSSAKVVEQSFTIRGKLIQSGVDSHFVNLVPLYVTRLSGKPVFLGNVIVNGEETPFQFAVKFQPRKLLVDPNGTLLTSPE
ncbi:MAG: hypothetical protein HY046_10935 [Acidobacteria bacterium]|nr:hypothetical protein [Acidobacteriota bacterium]